MITPSFSLTATERVLPRLALDFTTAVFDPRITFTRSGDTATVTDSSGVIVTALANTPRFDYDPLTLVCRGLLVEESRTNSLLNSLIDGTDLVTQSVTVTAAARTLSFYGTGTITLSGAHSAVVDGVGAYPARTTLVFTPTAGTLTLTVSGTVQFAQLESGNFATSFIPTAGSTVTRTVDVASMTGTDFSDWYNASEGTFVVQSSAFSVPSTTPDRTALAATDGTNLNRVVIRQQDGSGKPAFQTASGGSNVAYSANTTVIGSTPSKLVSAYKLNSFAFGQNGNLVATDSGGAVPVGVNRMNIGTHPANVQPICGHVQEVLYYPQRLTNAEVQAFSK
jgi:hypothetical protein